MRGWYGAALVAALATAGTAQAAPRFARVVTFGDSYADIGNVRAILQGAGLSVLYPEADYPTGRFSGGTNFADTIAAAYGAPQANYAIGGAQAGTGNVAAQGRLPGFRQQWVAFTRGGATYTDLADPVPIHVSGVPVAIPAGGLRFAADDLVLFSVGGNDARPYRRTGTLAGADAAAATAAARATEGIDALVARGIGTMVFTAGDVGRLAEAVGQANAPVGTAFSAAYNARMQAALAGYAARGVRVAYVDITTVADVADANLKRLGFDDTTTACLPGCRGDAAAQRRSFFYDGVHLTSAAFDLVGRYAVNQVDAPYGLRAVGDAPRLAAADFGRLLAGRLDLARDASPGLALFGAFSAARDRWRGDATSDGYRYRSKGGHGGVAYREGAIAAGVAFDYRTGHADGRGDDRVRARSYQLGGYVAAYAGAAFGQAYGGVGWHDLRLRRTGVVDPLGATPGALSHVAGGRIGVLPAFGPVRIGPTIGVDYAWARVHGYAETGDAAAALIVRRQASRTLLGDAGVEVRPAGASRIAPWLRVSAEAMLDGDGRSVRFAPAVASGIVNDFAIGAAARGTYGVVAGGVALAVRGPFSIEAQGRATFARDAGDQAAGTIGASLRF